MFPESHVFDTPITEDPITCRCIWLWWGLEIQKQFTNKNRKFEENVG